MREASTFSNALEIFCPGLQGRQVIATHSAWVQKALSDAHARAAGYSGTWRCAGSDIAGVIEQYTQAS